MKYIKLYEASYEDYKYRISKGVKFGNNSVWDIQMDLKEMCLELQDAGFKVAITEISYMRIKLSISKGRFLYSEVSEEIERIKDYMCGKGFKINIIKSFYIFKKGLREVEIEMDRLYFY